MHMRVWIIMRTWRFAHVIKFLRSERIARVVEFSAAEDLSNEVACGPAARLQGVSYQSRTQLYQWPPTSILPSNWLVGNRHGLYLERGQCSIWRTTQSRFLCRYLGDPEIGPFTVHRTSFNRVALSYVAQNVAVSQMKCCTEFVKVAWHHVFCCPVGTWDICTRLSAYMRRHVSHAHERGEFSAVEGSARRQACLYKHSSWKKERLREIVCLFNDASI